MATVLTDNFNSYNDADLAGQGSWATDGGTIGDWDVQGTVVREGAKAVIHEDTDTARYYKAGTNQDDGKQTCYFRRSQNSAGAIFMALSEGAFGTQRIIMRVGDDGNIAYHDGAVYQTIQAYSADTWYAITVEWRSSDHNARYSINGGTYTAWDTVFSNWVAGVDIFRIQSSSLGAGDKDYVDYIAENIISDTGNFFNLF